MNSQKLQKEDKFLFIFPRECYNQIGHCFEFSQDESIFYVIGFNLLISAITLIISIYHWKNYYYDFETYVITNFMLFFILIPVFVSNGLIIMGKVIKNFTYIDWARKVYETITVFTGLGFILAIFLKFIPVPRGFVILAFYSPMILLPIFILSLIFSCFIYGFSIRFNKKDTKLILEYFEMMDAKESLLSNVYI